jgi:adenine phosphoribosyltransferase
VLGLFADAEFFARMTAALAEPFCGSGVTKVASVEARGFAIGASVASTLRTGFVTVRKLGAIHPGAKVRVSTDPDWRGSVNELETLRPSLEPQDRVLVVDDWAETGSQATATRSLIERCGASYIGLSLLVDQLTDEMRERLAPVASIVRYDELPPSE